MLYVCASGVMDVVFSVCTAYCLHIFYKIQVVSNLARRQEGVCVPCLQSNIQG